jgi:putative Mg2+ transporter-C (MgtC) family protein
LNPGSSEFLSLPDFTQLLSLTIRLLVAAALGGVLGAERESTGKPAGLRTHMLVALGAALFALAPREVALSEGDIGRVIQGVAAGIGFIGAGTILKRSESGEITGLTTAASIWLTAAIGVAVGIGQLWVPIVAVACAWAILHGLTAAERRWSNSSQPRS